MGNGKLGIGNGELGIGDIQTNIRNYQLTHRRVFDYPDSRLPTPYSPSSP
jgi:hypothetical protein